MQTETFELTEEHIELLRRIEWDVSDDSPGGPSVGKRPFGNSNYTYDIIEILGWKPDGEDYTEEQEVRARKVFDQTSSALEIILQLKTFNPGTYMYIRENSSYERGRWKRKIEPYIP